MLNLAGPGELTVGVIGLGGMGSRMARRLLAGGHDVIAWNRSRAKLLPLAELGARAAATPADAASQADVIITMVAGPAALREVTEGPRGIAAGAGGSLTVIEMSTVGPAAVLRLGSFLPAATGLVDAPVVGSLAEAESGRLVILAGGPAPLVDRVEPVLSVLGATVRVGGPGCGAAAKLVANAALINTLGALGEALALAQALGLSRESAYRVLAATPLAAQAQRRRAALDSGQYPPRFPLGLAHKDARLITEAARAARADLRVTAAAGSWLADAESAGAGGQDYTAVLDTILHSSDRDPSRPRPSPAREVSAAGGEPVAYDGLIIDLDGVVWRGGDPVDGAAEAIAAVRAAGIRVLFLTNAPGRSRSDLAARLSHLGIPVTASDVMTSAAATARVVGALQDLASRRALVIGPPALRDEISQAGFSLVAWDEPAEAELVIVGGHEDFDYRELRAATTAIRGGARLFATGRDAVFPMPDGPWPATGAILAAVETAGGARATVVGKPGRIVFDIARQALSGCGRVAMIGDHLIADVAGAKEAGLGTILVLTGATSRAEVECAAVPPDIVLDSLAALPRLF